MAAEVLTPACCAPPTPVLHQPKGKEDKILDLEAYITGSPDATKAVLLAHDIYGWKTPLLRELADKIAGKGFLVVVPDFFRGDGVEQPLDFKSESFGKWIKLHHPVNSIDTAKQLIKHLKTGEVPKSVGVAGFCWGGKVAFAVAASTGDDAPDAIVALHPSLLQTADYEGLKVPTSILAAAHTDGVEDHLPILDKLRDQKLDIFVKIFPEKHGWTVKYDPSNEREVKAAEEAHDLTVEWFQRYL